MLDSAAAELSPHQSIHSSPKAAATRKWKDNATVADNKKKEEMHCVNTYQERQMSFTAQQAQVFNMCGCVPWLSSAACLPPRPESWCSRWGPQLFEELPANPSAASAG